MNQGAEFFLLERLETQISKGAGTLRRESVSPVASKKPIAHLCVFLALDLLKEKTDVAHVAIRLLEDRSSKTHLGAFVLLANPEEPISRPCRYRRGP